MSASGGLLKSLKSSRISQTSTSNPSRSKTAAIYNGPSGA